MGSGPEKISFLKNYYNPIKARMSLSQWISHSGDFAPEVFGNAWRNSQLSKLRCGATGF